MNYLCRMKSEIIILGTGNALVTRCYNTCFALRDENTTLLVDAGGGNGILRQLREVDIAIGEIHDMFVTLDTFHLLMSPLNWDPSNMAYMLVTFETFHLLMSPLN